MFQKISRIYGIFLILVSLSCHAEGEPWKYISNLHLVKNKLGFSLDESDPFKDESSRGYFEISYKENKLNEVSKDQLKKT
ncbi:MAG: hypothetical protein H7336_03410, partial [Bacteriovorax sp.]|nr:hypothetical protein [Bacteriovorax sp.]